MKFLYMSLGLGFISFFLMLTMITVTYGGMEIADRRVENAVVSAGWTAFSELDLEKIAERLYESNEEERELYLYKDISKEKIEEYIRKNLKLDNSYYPTEESFINLKSYPVEIKDIIIYNPDELPALTPSGKEVKRTSVYIRLNYPIKVKFLGNRFKKVEVIVDTETFYSRLQKERM